MDTAVLVPLDGSPLSYRALRHALDRYPEADITVLHVSNVFEPWHAQDPEGEYEPSFGSEEWYEMEHRAANQIFEEAQTIADEYDQTLTTDSEVGDPEHIIPEYAREEDIDHVVLGIHGREEPERSLFGRVAETVAMRSPVSVTLIR